MTTDNKFSWRKRFLSFRYAWQGITALFQREHNAWLHAAAASAAIACGIIWRISVTEWCLIILCIGGVISAEAINSSLETLADKVSDKPDPFIGKAKDLAAGAVLIMAIASVGVGLLIFLPKFIG